MSMKQHLYNFIYIIYITHAQQYIHAAFGERAISAIVYVISIHVLLRNMIKWL